MNGSDCQKAVEEGLGSIQSSAQVSGDPLPWWNLSPAELLVGRRICTSVPQTIEELNTQWPYLNDFRRQNQEVKTKQKQKFDQRHHTIQTSRSPQVTNWCEGEFLVLSISAAALRSYVVGTPTGQVHRNWQHLNPAPISQLPTKPDQEQGHSVKQLTSIYPFSTLSQGWVDRSTGLGPGRGRLVTNVISIT